MKKFVLAAVAASILSTPVFAAPFDGNNGQGRMEQRHDDRGGRDFQNGRDNRDFRGQRDFRGPQRAQFQHRDWKRGDRFESRYASNYRVINNYGAYRLHQPPRGYRWVQSGNDAVLIGVTTGIIAAVLANSIR
jgi:Ni/Co efflux regulator RcnB